MKVDKAKFFAALRPHVNLTTANVSGLDKVLNYALARGTPLGSLSYVLATGWWESAQTMQPVKEAYWKNEAWRKKNLRYYPWYGRGLIQTTWEDGYRKIAKAMGLKEDTFIKNPDLLLEFEYALPAMFIGMEKGIYTGKQLDDYIDNIDESDAEDLREWKEARRIVNGVDKQTTIANLALIFERALKAAGYVGKKGGKPIPVPPAPSPQPAPTTRKTFWEWLAGLFGARK